MLFLVTSSTIGVFLVKRESSRRSSLQTNHAISPEQNIFSEGHTIQIFKSLQGTLLWGAVCLKTSLTSMFNTGIDV